MLINNFKTWQELKIASMSDNDEVQCPSCHGKGIIHDQCECCTQETEHTCSLCEGRKKAVFGDLSKNDVALLFSKSVYHREVISDLEKLALWEGKNRINVLTQNGYSAYTLVANKTEIVAPSAYA